MSPSFSSCPPISPNPPCSGHGTLQSNGLCSCDALFTGASDLFDQRIAGSGGLSIDCPSSMIGIYIMWSFVLIVASLRAVNLSKALYVVHQRHQAKSIGAAMKLMAYRVLFLELFGTTPNFLALAILKLAYQHVIGTDIGVTICLTSTVIFYLIANSDLELAEFKMMVRAGMKTDDVRRSMVSRHRFFVITGAIIYIGLGIIPTYYMLSVDKSVGPTCNTTLALMLIRSVGVASWQLLSLIGKINVKNRMHDAVAIASSESPVQSKAQEVLSGLENEVKKNVKQCAVACTLYAIFMLPWLWTQQTYLVAFVTAIASLRHPGKHLMGEQSGNNTNNRYTINGADSARISTMVSSPGSDGGVGS
jgi:hypothetical protein